MRPTVKELFKMYQDAKEKFYQSPPLKRMIHPDDIGLMDEKFTHVVDPNKIKMKNNEN